MKVQVYSLRWLNRVRQNGDYIEVLFIGNLNPTIPIDMEIICKRFINKDEKSGLSTILGEVKRDLKFEGIFNINRDFFWEEVEKLFPNHTEINLVDGFHWQL